MLAIVLKALLPVTASEPSHYAVWKALVVISTDSAAPDPRAV